MKIDLRLFGGGSAASNKGSLGAESVTDWAKRMYRQRVDNRDARKPELQMFADFVNQGGIQGQVFIIVTATGEIINVKSSNISEVMRKIGRNTANIKYIQRRERNSDGTITVTDSLGFSSEYGAAQEVASDRSRLTTYTTTVTGLFSKALKK